MTTCSYKFHAIGQGCFFTGIFKDQAEDQDVLIFVFDCGSKTAGSYLTDEITKFKAKIKKTEGGRPVIDLLMVSHFDEDHVNGILELLENVKCTNLVIPYLSIQERLGVFSNGGAKAEWHRRFLQNPEQFIRSNEYDVDRIILIDGSDGLNDQINTLRISLDPGTKSNPSDPPSRYLIQENISLDDKTQYFKIPFSLETITIDWTFKFYIKPYSSTLIDAFEAELIKQFPSTSMADLFDDRKKLVIKGIYKKIFKDINKTSLNVSITKDKIKYVHYGDSPNQLFDYNKRIAGILLTGDASLKTADEIKEFKTYYKKEISETLLYQIPHHGSHNNSLLDDTSVLWSFPIFVLNYGSSRKKHPHKDVDRFVIDNGYNVKRNTEKFAVQLVYEIR
jgi:hypothetical protein